MFSTGLLRILERLAAFCMLSGVVLGLTVDQLLARAGFHTPLLPNLLKFETLPASSLQELERSSEARATDKVRLIVLMRPLSVEALEVLAQSTATSKPHMATELLVQAAALGWRNVAMQAAVIRSAASAKNWGVVAPRLLALTKLKSLDAIDPSTFVTADAREYAPQIVAAFADDGIAWFEFANWLRRTGRERESKYLLAQTPSYSDEDACNQLGLLARQFVKVGEIDFAAELIGSRCRGYLTPASSGLIIDQHFGEVSRGPFEWQMAPHSGLSVRTGMLDGKAFVEVVNADPLTRKIASKLVLKSNFEKFRVIEFENLSAKDLQPNSLQLYYECVAFGGRYKEPLKLDVKSFGGDCAILRVGFELPTGRFRVWSD